MLALSPLAAQSSVSSLGPLASLASLTSPPSATIFHARIAAWEATRLLRGAQPPSLATVPADAAGLRLSQFAGGAFATLGSRTQAVRAAKRNLLAVNGHPAEPARVLREGDVVRLAAASSSVGCRSAKAVSALAERVTQSGFDAIYEDDTLAVVYKPAGLHSKPYAANVHLEGALPALLSPPSPCCVDALGAPVAVHRLDYRVCGLLVVAKTQSAAAFLSEEFRERRVKKRYRALLLGRMSESHPGAFSIEDPIDGRSATTEVRVVEETPHLQAGALNPSPPHPHPNPHPNPLPSPPP